MTDNCAEKCEETCAEENADNIEQLFKDGEKEAANILPDFAKVLTENQNLQVLGRNFFAMRQILHNVLPESREKSLAITKIDECE